DDFLRFRNLRADLEMTRLIGADGVAFGFEIESDGDARGEVCRRRTAERLDAANSFVNGVIPTLVSALVFPRRINDSPGFVDANFNFAGNFQVPNLHWPIPA